MIDFPIPHIPPIKFVDSLISSDEKNASVKIKFDQIPTIGMLVEAAAQSSSGIDDGNKEKIQMGFLIALKNIKLLEEPLSKEYILNIHLDHKIENFKSFSFIVLDNDKKVASGSISISLEEV
ncbi:MAG: hypothetical protein GXO11_06595 [Epsilonproteobacteria bacterium]|nr:hypothetical protein [Campylobacterota bacterium]